MRVEARRDQDPGRPELLNDRGRHLVEGPPQQVAGRPGGHGCSSSGPAHRPAHLGGGARCPGRRGTGGWRRRARTGRPRTRPASRCRGARPSRRPVPARPSRQGGGGHGDVVHQAEAHGAIGQGVVTRRAGGHEGHPLAPLAEKVDGLQPGPRREQRGRPRVGVGVRVGVQVATARSTELLETGQVRRPSAPGPAPPHRPAQEPPAPGRCRARPPGRRRRPSRHRSGPAVRGARRRRRGPCRRHPTARRR